jgi:hypothetical protein
MNKYTILVEKPEGKRSLERSKRRWENIIKTDLKETARKDVDCINAHQVTDQWLVPFSKTMIFFVL